MIPLAAGVIVREHGNLPYPEGTACAVRAGGRRAGGSFPGKVFAGLGIASSTVADEHRRLWKDVLRGARRGPPPFPMRR